MFFDHSLPWPWLPTVRPGPGGHNLKDKISVFLLIVDENTDCVGMVAGSGFDPDSGRVRV